MLLDFSGPVQTDSVAWLPLQTLVYEISCFERPSFGQLMPLDLHLAGEHHIPNVVSGLTDVGPPAKHEFVADNAYSEIVDGVSVVLATHNFWGHVTRRPGSVTGVLGPPDLCDTHVSDPHVATFFHDDVLWLDISMNDALDVHIFKSQDHAGEHKLGLFFIKSSHLTDVVAQITPGKKVTYEIEVFSVLERVVNVYKKSTEPSEVSRILTGVSIWRVVFFR